MAYSEKNTVYEYLLGLKKDRKAGFMVLMDPDRLTLQTASERAKKCEDTGVDALLIGTSLMMGAGFETFVETVKKNVSIPVIIFPAEKSHVTPRADAVLFLSLLSGRNPELLIGEQVKSAPLIKAMGVEAISTAYLLIESGKLTSVEYMSNTKPIPSDKPEIAVAHAVAAEIFGMKMVYLEAGSGAERPVRNEMIKAVSSNVNIPVIVGGGLKNSEIVAEKVNAGASFIVVGNHFETETVKDSLAEFVKAAHGR